MKNAKDVQTPMVIGSKNNTVDQDRADTVDNSNLHATGSLSPFGLLGET